MIYWIKNLCVLTSVFLIKCLIEGNCLISGTRLIMGACLIMGTCLSFVAIQHCYKLDIISKFWNTKSDELIKIPMLGSIDSLNVSVSTAIVLYEINRQNDFNR